MAASRFRLNMDKTELIWTGTKHNLSKIPGSGRALTLGFDTHVAQSDDVRVLGVQLSSDLSLDKHVNVVRIFLSTFKLLSTMTTTLQPASDVLWMTTLSLHSFMHSSRAELIIAAASILTGVPRKTTDKLQRVLNSAARIVSNTRNFDRGL